MPTVPAITNGITIFPAPVLASCDGVVVLVAEGAPLGLDEPELEVGVAEFELPVLLPGLFRGGGVADWLW